jgi:DNA-3-methyladenine glycosylase
MDWSRTTHQTAEDLLGSKLCRATKKNAGGKKICATIYEVEIYDGPHDLASHAAKGETERTKIMFGPPGYWYVYLCYGVHWLLNLVTREKGYPAGILIRGVILERDEKGKFAKPLVLNGPGKLTKALGIDGSLYGTKASATSGLWIEWRKGKAPAFKKTPRIGINYAGERWKNEKLRYLTDGLA